MSTLSYGLNITKKPPSLAVRPPPAKRKTIFDDDSGPEDGPDDEDNAESIDTIGGLTTTSASKPTKTESAKLISKPSKPTKISQYGDLSTQHSSSRHAKSAQTIDPSIYDYDSIYDSLHAKPSSTSSAPADAEKRPKYMSSLMNAAEVRKRDQLRAKEKMLAKEREAEGDEFADKEKFVTSAYKRQQEEMRRLEAEEAIREKEAEERKRREGGGLKGLYKNMLEKDERKHAAVMKAVETAKVQGPERGPEKKEKVGKSEADLAREKGAIINEDGQVVDKRQLLNAGLNASSTPKPSSRTAPDPKSRSGPNPPTGARTGVRERSNKESARERETRLFEEQLLGKRAFTEDEEDDGGEAARAAKSRKLEDEILAGLGG
ncbi:hypothetical protein MMC07_005731 [Pseudocyphellaria aurata]|nr:hypothetical protein [Pseudocyphellaria aurata]